MNLFRKLLSEAQFHGAKSLIKRKYRLYWAAALALFFCISCVNIFHTTNRFFKNPAYVVIHDTNDTTTIFPSVVVCPEIVFPEDRIENFLSGLNYPSGMNSSYIKTIIYQLAAFYSPEMKFSLRDVRNIELLLKFNMLDVETTSRRLILPCEETILRCRLFGVMMNCSRLFKMELAHFGYCCVFNGRSLNREIREHGIHSVPPPPVLLTDEKGHSSGLMFVVNSSQRIRDTITYKWMYLKGGNQFVEIGDNGTIIAPNHEYWVGYLNKKFLLDEDVRSLSPEVRRCKMSWRKLQYFPSYNKRYCILECEMRRTLKRCFCVKLTHPRSPNIKTCGAKHLMCVRNLAVTYDSSLCNCPPTCDSNTDMMYIQSYPMVPGDYIADYFYHGLNFSKVTVVRVYVLNQNTALISRRSYYSSMNLFSQIGGTLNVFFGCSILTLVELIQLIWSGYRQYKIVMMQRKAKPLHQETANAKTKLKNKIMKTKKKIKFQKR